MYYVYVLISLKDKMFYVGFTNNLNRRISEHNRGDNVSTKYRAPFVLVYFEGHCNKKDALRREGYLKTAKGKTMLKYVIRNHLEEIL